MVLYVSHFADNATGLGALGINLQAYIIQLLTFLLVLLALRRWAFKPILKMLNERRALIENGVTIGEKMRAAEAQAEADVAERLRTARATADQIIAEANRDAKQVIADAEATAEKRADQVIQDAKTQITLASARERRRLEGELIGLVAEVSHAVIGEKVDDRKDSALIEKALHARKAA